MINLRARNLVRGRADKNNEQGFIKAINVLREKLSPEHYPALQKFMNDIPEAQRTGLGILPQTLVSNIHRRQPFNAIDIGKELVWTALLLRASLGQLKNFISLGRELASATMGADFAQAYLLTEKIIRKCGFSLFTLEAQIALLQLKDGFEAQRAFTDNLGKKKKRNFYSFIAYHVSRRNEENLSIARFSSRIDKYKPKWELEQDFEQYIEFRLLSRIPKTKEDLAGLLRHEQTTSIIDLYETFLRVLRISLAKSYVSTAEKILIFKSLSPLRSCDPRLSSIMLLIEIQRGESIAAQDHPKYLTDYYRGNYDEAALGARAALAHDPADACALLYAARAITVTAAPLANGKSPCERILTSLHSIRSRDNNAERAMASLTKLCLNFRFIPATDAVVAAANLINSPRGLGERSLEIGILTGQDWQDMLDFELLGLTPNPPDWYQHGGWAPERLAERDYINLARTGDFTNALTAANRLSMSAYESDKTDSIVASAWILTRLNRIDEAIALIARETSHLENIYLSFPIDEIMKSIGAFKAMRKKLYKLEFIVFVYLKYKLSQTQDNRNHVRWACDEFLSCHDLKCPSAIASIPSSFDAALVVYFLREVCRTDLLQSVRGLKTSRSVKEERRNICSFLIELDPINANQYREEITQLTTMLLIEEGLQIVDRSRLYVNLDGISNWANQELRDNFDIYISRRQASDETATQEFEQAIRDFYTEQKPISKEYLDLPRDDHHSLLINIITELHTQYLLNSEHGLDYYLSMRLRHGTIAGTLRGPLEERKLITKLDSSTGKYHSNTYWLTRLAVSSSSDILAISNVFGWLSEQYDLLINTEVKTKLYIRKDEDGSLIGKKLAPIVFNLIRHSISDQPSFEEFLSACYQFFGKVLAEELTTVRALLQERFSSGLHRLIQETSSKLAEYIEEPQRNDLRSALIAANSEANNSLIKVVEWLHLEEIDESKNSFTIEQILAVALESAKRTLRGFSPVITTSLSVERKMQVNSLSIISDIIFVAMENVYKHSKIEANPWMKIEISNELDRVLEIVITSEIADGVHSVGNQRILSEIQDAINSSQYHKHVATEGRSGLIKIKQIVGDAIDGNFEFGFKNDCEFYLKIKLSITDIPDKGWSTILPGVSK